MESKSFTCTICESTRIQEIPETGHINKITKFVKEISCTSEGYTGDIYCQECGKLLEEGTVFRKRNIHGMVVKLQNSRQQKKQELRPILAAAVVQQEQKNLKNLNHRR